MNLRQLINALAIYQPIRRLKQQWNRGVVTLEPPVAPRGRVLLSYTTLPFVGRKGVLGGHTNQWECKAIAGIFLNRGYAVDVIDTTNEEFTPKHRYDYFFDVHSNFDRIAPALPTSCTKIFHGTTSYWKFQNAAELERLDELEKRRGIRLSPRRQLAPSDAFESADAISLLGNKVTESTYPAGKKITLIPLSTTHTFNAPEKDFNVSRTHFVWIGGSGMVHKGLDLLLEAFVKLPQYRLSICGKVENEKDFVAAYRKELYESKNISVLGLVDPGSSTFEKLRLSAASMIYPSCAEGQAGSVILAMHAGFIPIVSKHSGVDVGDSGIALTLNSIEEITEAIVRTGNADAAELTRMSLSAWNYARARHTKETFAQAYRSFVDTLELNKSHGA